MWLWKKIITAFILLVIGTWILDSIVDSLNIVVKFWIFDFSGFFKSLIVVLLNLFGFLFISALRGMEGIN
jgi:hypothetical protein